jgi:hypothetical protein
MFWKETAHVTRIILLDKKIYILLGNKTSRSPIPGGFGFSVEHALFYNPFTPERLRDIDTGCERLSLDKSYFFVYK